LRDLDMQELDALMRDKLETHCRQQLSAMLDGALAPDEARFLLRRLQHDHELAGCWERWQLCGDLLRGSMPALLPRDFSQRVLGAVADEGRAQAAVAHAAGRAGHRWGWAGGAALAASVAVAALFVTQRNPAMVEPTVTGTVAPLAAAATSPDTPVIPQQSAPEPTPATSAPDTAASVAAAALVASELPRRATRRAREPLRRAVAQRVESQPSAVVEVAVAEPGGQPGTHVPDTVASQDPFAASALAPARPWPRAVLPGLASGALTVDYETAGTSSGYDYFEPQLPVDDEAPVD
jgi:negative regulator of sigma E activity